MIKALGTESDLQKLVTGLIVLENTHTDSVGVILSLEYLSDHHKISKVENIPFHMVGARIFCRECCSRNYDWTFKD